MFSDSAFSVPDHFSDLMERVAQFKDKAAFGTLFFYYGPRVKAYFLHHGAQDAHAEELAQDVMVIVWREAKFFHRSRASVSTWLFRIARNICRNSIGHTTRPNLNLDDTFLFPSAPVAADSLISGAQRDRLVRKAIVDLPEEQKTLLRQAFYDGLSHREIAEKNRVSLGTITTRLRLAFSKLRSAQDVKI